MHQTINPKLRDQGMVTTFARGSNGFFFGSEILQGFLPLLPSSISGGKWGVYTTNPPTSRGIQLDWWEVNQTLALGYNRGRDYCYGALSEQTTPLASVHCNRGDRTSIGHGRTAMTFFWCQALRENGKGQQRGKREQRGESQEGGQTFTKL